MRLLRLLGRRGEVVGLVVGSLHGCAWEEGEERELAPPGRKKTGLTKNMKLSETTENLRVSACTERGEDRERQKIERRKERVCEKE